MFLKRWSLLSTILMNKWATLVKIRLLHQLFLRVDCGLVLLKAT